MRKAASSSWIARRPRGRCCWVICDMVELPESSNDPFEVLRRATPARVGLGRAGQGLPTAPMLAFQLAHARARDAVLQSLDVERLAADLVTPTVLVHSAAPNRETYLKDPDLGRRFQPQTATLARGEYDLAIVVADGLSALAVQSHAPSVVRALTARLEGWSIAPIV